MLKLPTKTYKPLLFKLRSSSNFIIWTVAVAMFTDCVLYGIVVPVFPFSLEERVGIGKDEVQPWIAKLLAVFAIGGFVGAPVFGWIADNTNARRMPLLIGLILLLSSTMMLWLGRTISIMVVARLAQGLATSVIYSVGMALVADTVGRAGVAVAMGLISPAMSIGYLISPPMGGLLYQHGGYDMVFAYAIAMVAIDIVFRLLIIERKDAARIESEHATLPTTAPAEPTETTSLLPNATQNTESEEELTPECSIPMLILLRNPRILVSLFCSFNEALVATTFETTLALYVKETFHFGSAGAGLVFLIVVSGTVFSPWIGSLCDRIGARPLVTAGFFLCSLTTLLAFITEDTTAQRLTMYGLLAFIGLGLALVMTPVMAEVTFIVMDMEEERPGRFGKNGAFAQAYAIWSVAYSAGSFIGPFLSGYLVHRQGWTTMSIVMGALSFFAAVVTSLLMGSHIPQPPPETSDVSNSRIEGSDTHVNGNATLQTIETTTV